MIEWGTPRKVELGDPQRHGFLPYHNNPAKP